MARVTPDVVANAARPDPNSGSSELAGSLSDIVGPTGPVGITTTKDVSRVMLPSKVSGISAVGVPVGPDGGDPIGSTEWMDPQQKVHNVMDGYLDIVGTSDEGPMTVKIASLGFSYDNTGHNPFQLGPETEFGSVVSLAPTEPSDASAAMLGSQVSNHTMAAFDALSVPLSVFSTYNTTSTSSSAATTPITVRLMANAPAENLLCVVYNNNYDQVQDRSSMYLQPCDDPYIPGAPSAPRGSSETQLWQYDPATREVRPLLFEIKAMGEPVTMIEPSWTSSGYAAATSSAIMVVETAPPLPAGTESSITVSAARGEAGTSDGIAPASSRAPSPSIARRDGGGDTIAQKSKSKHPKLPKPGPTIQKQGGLTPSLVAVPLVDPYNLVFTPRSSIAGTQAKVQPPA
ncbi:hypothetical protein FRC10_012034 [Ceratobasidium sp. 414]|nr:hypothetical protein FRC10_012034 [Ceratobasidium sp. 414]